MSEELTPSQVANIAFVKNGGNKKFVYAVYKNGTIIAWTKTSDLTEDQIKTKANEFMNTFPDFIPGTPYGDFKINKGKKEWYGENAKKVRMVTYYHPAPYISCMIGSELSDLETGMAARENLKKDVESREIICVGFNPV